MPTSNLIYGLFGSVNFPQGRSHYTMEPHPDHAKKICARGDIALSHFALVMDLLLTSTVAAQRNV
jgi:hypothetical protein